MFVVLQMRLILSFSFFFFNDTATTEIYTLSLHDALPIWVLEVVYVSAPQAVLRDRVAAVFEKRSEEHTSELQSRRDLVCRLLLEKKKTNKSQFLMSADLPTTSNRTPSAVLHSNVSYVRIV